MQLTIDPNRKWLNIVGFFHHAHTSIKWSKTKEAVILILEIHIILLYIHYCSKVWSKDALNWSKVTVKTFIILENIYILNKC